MFRARFYQALCLITLLTGCLTFQRESVTTYDGYIGDQPITLVAREDGEIRMQSPIPGGMGEELLYMLLATTGLGSLSPIVAGMMGKKRGATMDKAS